MHKAASTSFSRRVETWQGKAAGVDPRRCISNEKLLTVFLFGIISLVAIFLVFCIFYMIVIEKTRDIGIIKSVGATSTAVAGIFLGYGLANDWLGWKPAGDCYAAIWSSTTSMNCTRCWANSCTSRFGILKSTCSTRFPIR